MRSKYVGIAAAAIALAAALWVWQGRRARWDPSREYVIGSDNAYPYHAVDEHGKVSGFAAEVLDEAARRLGMRLRWVRARGRGVDAMRSGETQLWPLISAESKEFYPGMHLSEPWINNDFAFVALRSEFRNLANAARVRRVAFREQPNARRLSRANFPGAELVPALTREEAVEKVCAGEVDGAVVELRPAYLFMAVRPPKCEGQPPCFVGLTFRGEQLGTASRPEAAAVADALRGEIDRMGADGTLERILLPWSYFQSNEAASLYGERRRQQTLRVLAVLFALALVLLAVVANQYFLLRRVQRARDLAHGESWAKTKFMRRMSHELRTPLNGIMMGAELLETTRLDGEQKEFTGIIRNSGETMLRLVQDLLDLSKHAAPCPGVLREKFEIRNWVDSALAPFHLTAREKGIAIQVAFLPFSGEGRVQGDPVRLGQVLVNLVSNAVRHAGHGTVQVEVALVESAAGWLLDIAVRDEGDGIPAERLKVIFDGKGEEIQAAGHGLGLGIAAELVREMGGTIDAASEPGRGSVFRFRVPVEWAGEGAAASAQGR